MTYFEFIAKFPECSYFDKIPKGLFKHHVNPITTQLTSYNKEHNTSLSKKDFIKLPECDHRCILVSFEDHVRAHYYYSVSFPEDLGNKVALAYMCSIQKSFFIKNGLPLPEDFEEMLKTVSFSVPEEIVARRIQTLKDWHETEEGKACLKKTGGKISKSLKEFFKSEKGLKNREEASQRLRIFYQTEEGKEAIKKSRDKLKIFYQTEEGRKLREEVRQKISESRKAFFKTEEGKEFARMRAERLSAALNDRGRRLRRAQPWLIEGNGDKFIVYSLSHFCKMAFPKPDNMIVALHDGRVRYGWTARKITREEADILKESLFVYY